MRVFAILQSISCHRSWRPLPAAIAPLRPAQVASTPHITSHPPVRAPRLDRVGRRAYLRGEAGSSVVSCRECPGGVYTDIWLACGCRMDGRCIGMSDVAVLQSTLPLLATASGDAYQGAVKKRKNMELNQ